MVSIFQETEKYKIKNNAAEMNEMFMFHLTLPKNKGLTAFIDFKLYKHHLSSDFIAFNSANLYKILPKLLEDDEDDKKK